MALAPTEREAAVDQFSGARALAAFSDVKLEVWPTQLERSVTGDVVLVAASHPAGRDLGAGALTHRAETGGTVILLTDLDGRGNGVISSVVPARVGAEVLADTEDPIVGSQTVKGQGIAHDRVHQIQFKGVRQVHGGHPIALAGGAVVGAEFTIGDGRVIVLADSDIFTDAQIGRAENAAFFVGLIRSDLSAVDSASILASLPFSCDANAWTDVLTVDLQSRAAKLSAAAEALADEFDDLTVERAIIASKSKMTTIGSKALRAIAEFRGDGPRPAALCFKNVPFQEPGPTPESAGRPTRGYNVALALLLATANGEPVGYRQESGGALIQEILPTRADAQRQTSLSSEAELLLHIETAFHELRPDAVGLHCLRGDPNGHAQTLLASVPKALAELTLADITALSEPRFRTSADESFIGRRDRGEHRMSRPFAVLSGSMYDPFVTFDLDLLIGDDAEAARALGRLNEAVLAHRVGIVLKSGMVLIVANRHAVHGRTPFRATFDGRDRWLLRTMLAGQLPSTEYRTGRIIETRYL